MESEPHIPNLFDHDWFIDICNWKYYLKGLVMTEISTREFDDLKGKVNEIHKDVKTMTATLNTHVQWEEGYQAQFRAKLDNIEEKTTSNTHRIDSHESRLDGYDVWKAGFLSHIKGIWATIIGLSVIFGLLSKLGLLGG